MHTYKRASKIGNTGDCAGQYVHLFLETALKKGMQLCAMWSGAQSACLSCIVHGSVTLVWRSCFTNYATSCSKLVFFIGVQLLQLILNNLVLEHPFQCVHFVHQYPLMIKVIVVCSNMGICQVITSTTHHIHTHQMLILVAPMQEILALMHYLFATERG